MDLANLMSPLRRLLQQHLGLQLVLQLGPVDSVGKFEQFGLLVGERYVRFAVGDALA